MKGGDMAEKKSETTQDIVDARIVQIPSNYTEVIELEDGRRIDSLELQIEIYNKLCKVEKKLG